MNIRIAIASLALVLTASPAHADIVDGEVIAITDTITDITDAVLPGVTNIRLGLGPAISPEYEGSDDYDIGIKPLISFQYRDLIVLDNNNIRINLFGADGLFRSESFKAGPLLKVDFGRDESDSPDLAGMGDVGTGIELGLFASYTIDQTRARIRWVQDVTGGHSGMKFIGDIRTFIYKSDKLAVIGSVISTWADNDYMQSYFGVTVQQSQRSGMSEFNAGSGVKDATLALNANYSINNHWAFLANIGYSRLLGDAKNSPLVDVRGSADQFSAGVFAVYIF